jgi:hypothetical protein
MSVQSSTPGIAINKLFLIRAYTSCQLLPLVNMAPTGQFVPNIPGLNAAVPLNFTVQVYAENPQGLNR